jgi:IclR family acetate operon transcriptional repressor
MSGFAKALDRGLDVLEALVSRPDGLPYNELLRVVDIPPASFARLLKALTIRGYVEKSDTGRYFLGVGAYRLAEASRSASPLLLAAEGVLDRLVAQTQESAELVELHSHHMVFLDRRESPQAVVLKARPGSVFDLKPTNALGLVATAYRPDLPRDLGEPELQAIRQLGVACRLQNNDQVFRAAAPIFDANRRCVGALAVALPAFRLDDEIHHQLILLLRQEAAGISSTLGFPAMHPQETTP